MEHERGFETTAAWRSLRSGIRCDCRALLAPQSDAEHASSCELCPQSRGHYTRGNERSSNGPKRLCE